MPQVGPLGGVHSRAFPGATTGGYVCGTEVRVVVHDDRAIGTPPHVELGSVRAGPEARQYGIDTIGPQPAGGLQPIALMRYHSRHNPEDTGYRRLTAQGPPSFGLPN